MRVAWLGVQRRLQQHDDDSGERDARRPPHQPYPHHPPQVGRPCCNRPVMPARSPLVSLRSHPGAYQA
eukprot:7436855-Pyramimonas_sp.AAC.1